jgi:hypothetical protein
MDDAIASGTRRLIDGVPRVYYHGYWIKAYQAPEDSLSAKKRLIEALTRRLFNHVEHGISVPGTRLNDARRAYDAETDPQRKRVKGSMLAGALFNRATDIFTKLVELQELGVAIGPDDALMRECGEHLQEALELGKLVLHRSGEEGIDELWGEPFKAFSFPIEEFYRSRYVKVAHTMRCIDGICAALKGALEPMPAFPGIAALVDEFAAAAKLSCETLRAEPDVFDVWTSFVVAGERMVGFVPRLPVHASAQERQSAAQGVHLLARARELVAYVARARVSMPKSSREFAETCRAYAEAQAAAARRASRAPARTRAAGLTASPSKAP